MLTWAIGKSERVPLPLLLLLHCVSLCVQREKVACWMLQLASWMLDFGCLACVYKELGKGRRHLPYAYFAFALLFSLFHFNAGFGTWIEITTAVKGERAIAVSALSLSFCCVELYVLFFSAPRLSPSLFIVGSFRSNQMQVTALLPCNLVCAVKKIRPVKWPHLRNSLS